MEKAYDRARLMGEGEIGKILWKFAIPAIVSQVIAAVYNIADTMFVGMLGNTAAIGGVTVAFPLYLMINAVGIMFGIGLSSYSARLLGENKKQKAKEVLATVIVTAFGVAICIMIIVVTFLEPILKGLGATDTIMPYAIQFIKPLISGAVCSVLFPVIANAIRAEGNTKYSAFAVGISGILNVILDPIFIFTFNMGVRGAGIATLLSQVVSVLFLFYYYICKKSLLELSFKNFKPSKNLYKEVLKVGVANLLIQVFMSLSMAFLNIAAKPYGDAAIAAIGISVRVSALVLFIIWGYNQGFQPIASYNYGAKKYDRLQKAINISIFRTSVFAVLVTILLWIFSKNAINLFSNDEQVIKVGIKALRAVITTCPLLGFLFVHNSLFQAIGKGKEALLLGVSRQGVVFIPTILMLSRIFGLNGILYSQAVADIITIILAVFLSRRIKIELDKKIKSAEVEAKHINVRSEMIAE